jgi:aspartokinase
VVVTSTMSGVTDQLLKSSLAAQEHRFTPETEANERKTFRGGWALVK